MQNIFSLLILTFTLSIFLPSQAGPIIVGNGAGISEQNLYFTFQNSGSLSEPCLEGNSCSLDSQEKELLKNYVTDSRIGTLIWEKNSCSESFIQRNDWVVCQTAILSEDNNQDGFLDLGESFQLLLEIHFKHSQVNRTVAQSLKEKVRNHFNFKSFDFRYILKNNFQFHVFGFKDRNESTHIYIQNQNSKALKIDQLIMDRLACRQVEVSTPYVIDSDLESKNWDVLMGFPITEFCDPSSIIGKNHRLIFNLRFLSDRIEIH